MSPSYNSQLVMAAEVQNRLAHLIDNINFLGVRARKKRSRSLARQYNNIRRDVIRLVNEPDLTTLIPKRVWCLEVWHVLLGIIMVAILASMGTTRSLINVADNVPTLEGRVIPATQTSYGTLCYPAMLLALILVFVVVWYRAARVQLVEERAVVLLGFFRDFIRRDYPELAISFSETPSWQAMDPNLSVAGQISHLRQLLTELENQYDMLTRRITDLDKDIGTATESYRRGAYQEIRDDLTNKREEIIEDMTDIEQQLTELKGEP